MGNDAKKVLRIQRLINGASGFSAYSTADDVTQGIDGTALTAIVTGASSGIGVETARVLALRGVHVVMAVRNLDAGRNVKEAIHKEINGAKIDVMQLDLSSKASNCSCLCVQRLIASLSLLESNNAGVMATPFMLSHDNIELQFATNHLGYSDCNLAVIKREGRIVNLSSKGHRIVYGEGNPFDHINDESGYFPRFAYGQSKLANILHANELSRRLKDEGVEITANSLHPGSIIMTDLMRHHGLIKNMLRRMVPVPCIKVADLGCAWAFLNDLPRNDFNTVFKSVPSFNGRPWFHSRSSKFFLSEAFSEQQHSLRAFFLLSSLALKG
ncbi:hypothetical protein Gotri_003319 [Gossypium trilobum]|uniref:Short-chain dehydrogenase TIC 32, chloroplastic-like n=1 Tax=Gossypium trilobum TaxID=34281 RepID=A0A7J9F346_9ROSI|nr:hypothetical protein [Gossypium trilobum]